MCGIFGFLSSSRPQTEAPGEEFFRALAELATFAPRGPSPVEKSPVEKLSEAEREAWLLKLDRARGETYRWLEQGPFLEALMDEKLQARLRQAAAAVAAWSGALEEHAREARFNRQRDWEFLNSMIVGGKDIAWQLERDLLGNFAPLLALLGEGEASGAAALSPQALGHAWQLQLILSNLNRLEVRGRDSAGLAVYLRFPESGQLDRFLDGPGGAGSRRQELESRSARTDLSHGTLLRPATHSATVLAVFKVAREVGKMGDNVAFLRSAIAKDRFFQAALRQSGVELQCLAHTRWASNGVISLPNCHPVDSSLRRGGSGGAGTAREAVGAGEILAVLNGDIDNYRDLLRRHVEGEHLVLDQSITTDAKIIPIVVARHYRDTGDLGEALRRALDEFEGSMAIGVMAADRPQEIAFAQKGSGQGLFFGLTGGAVAVASEMYGIVELTPRYVKAEGEKVEGGEVFHLRAGDRDVAIELIEGTGGAAPRKKSLLADRIRSAEITTRDINRGDQPHFFLKEIGESVESVRKTLRGKFEIAGGKARFLLGADVLPADLLEALRSGRLRRILVIGQGTAAVAAEGAAHLLESALARATPPFQVKAFKATELSGHHLSPDMSDCLVVAVSQSGTTTDTNRTVDLARERGAWVLGIVNRRNSDLVYKSHGVLYTSDGRDIEMSVASTKAFYSQNAAGQILALCLAAELGTLAPAEILRAIEELEALPRAMERVLALAPRVAEIARRVALKRRHWALVGSGAAKIAANEIRIKLSELCYKSIAVDFLEDKKHIDLSSEPLVLVCAAGLPAETVSDAVKEVSIFKAHNSIPIVITDEGEDRFDPYAAGTIKIPAAGGPLNYLLATMVGHLFGYHAAASYDHFAERLRRVRAAVVDGVQVSAPEFAPELPAALVEEIVKLEETLLAGSLDGGLNAGTATRLAAVLALLLGRLPVDSFSRQHPEPLAGVVAALTDAIGELSRPIDAIKHQAKTVTVGISRSDSSAREGFLWATFRGFGLSSNALAATHRRFLNAFEPLVAAVEGATLYRLEGLDPLGRPTADATIRVLAKTGCAGGILSRCEEAQPLSGTKWGTVKRRDIYLGHGQMDRRKILIVPVVGEETHGQLLLYHLDVIPRGRRDARLRALEALEDRFERLRVAVTEGNVPWDPKLIDLVDNETLFFASPDGAAEEILGECAPTKGFTV